MAASDFFTTLNIFFSDAQSFLAVKSILGFLQVDLQSLTSESYETQSPMKHIEKYREALLSNTSEELLKFHPRFIHPLQEWQALPPESFRTVSVWIREWLLRQATWVIAQSSAGYHFPVHPILLEVAYQL